MTQTPSRWRVVGASVIGTSHRKVNTPCHDVHGYAMLSGGELIMVVSDGAGSAEHAEIGSQIAVDSALSYLSGQLAGNSPDDETQWRDLLVRAFQAARAEIEQKAVDMQLVMRDFAATLAALILTEDWTVGALIGDCAIVTLHANGELISLCPPQKGEYANMTNFLSMPDALERLDIQARRERATSAVVISDGLLELALNIAQNTPYSKFFTPLFAFVEHSDDGQATREQLAAFLDSERINARTDDDKTLVLASRREPEAELATPPDVSEQREEDEHAGHDETRPEA